MKGIQERNVEAYFAESVEGAEPPLEFTLIQGGHSNLTFKVTDSRGQAFVLRRPPTGAVLATAHDMAREHRILAGLAKSDVPVPPVLALCEDVAVNDAPFYVMKYVDGVVLTDATSTEKHVPTSQRAGLGEHVIQVLASLHKIEPDDVGLGDLGRREAYLERQLKRWHVQWEKSKTRELPQMEEAYQALSDRMPVQKGAVIVHGDYRLGNMLVADGRIAAVLDWELCTLGDPLADVGYLMNNWAGPEDKGGPNSQGAAVSPTSTGGFPDRDAMLRRYTELTGRETDGIDYYRAFQSWRLAAIVEGVLARYLKGVMGNEANTDVFRSQVDGLAQGAVDLLRRLPD